MTLGVNFALGGDLRKVLPVGGTDLFRTRIWQAKLLSRIADVTGYLTEIANVRAHQPEPAGRTNRGGWNSDDKRILERPEFASLRALIADCIDFAFMEMGQRGLGYDLQSWVNLHEKGGFNFLHVHEGSYLSGCLYLCVPDGSGSLVFRDPRPGVLLGFLKGTVANGYSDICLRPEDGLLVLFPPWLEHFVEPHAGHEPRVVIAFDAVPRS